MTTAQQLARSKRDDPEFVAKIQKLMQVKPHINTSSCFVNPKNQAHNEAVETMVMLLTLEEAKSLEKLENAMKEAKTLEIDTDLLQESEELKERLAKRSKTMFFDTAMG